MSNDDRLGGSRLVGQRAVILDWNLDWACRSCRRFGAIQVQITGGGLDPKTQAQTPKTDDEEFHRKLWIAHRNNSPLCAADYRTLLVGHMWRIQRTMRGNQTIVLQQRGAPPQEGYRWPPWAD